MDSLLSKVSYLNGLIDGMEIDKTSKEGRIISEMAKILEAMADKIEILEDSQDELEEYIDSIDEDLSAVEEDLYEDDECDDCFEDDDYDNYISINCPHCDETVYIDTNICNCNEQITCPNCHKEIPLEDCCED
ncbi:hypothetical protein JK636_19600 [Clostridium sp. YIM B02515]|uniref:Zinc ribbon domain-containing protein n=1 Tax=Clostridium rhizosphaerae TaxID=2803861 RepID=A0ABS1TEV8_9CLOT|nr:CD1247 N-terminal domain-containing protein [Clostridium rhizosphaerae]MBL4937918.1 hypothetical protein [Clostridium rhizosphaerae]